MRSTGRAVPVKESCPFSLQTMYRRLPGSMRQSTGRGESAVTQAPLGGSFQMGSRLAAIAVESLTTGSAIFSPVLQPKESIQRHEESKEQAEQIIRKLREVEVAVGRGKTVGEVGSNLDEL